MCDITHSHIQAYICCFFFHSNLSELLLNFHLVFGTKHHFADGHIFSISYLIFVWPFSILSIRSIVMSWKEEFNKRWVVTWTHKGKYIKSMLLSVKTVHFSIMQMSKNRFWAPFIPFIRFQEVDKLFSFDSTSFSRIFIRFSQQIPFFPFALNLFYFR